MHTHPDDPAIPRINRSAGHPPGADAPAAPAPDPTSPAVPPTTTASSIGAHTSVRPTVPQEDLEEVPDAISPFGPS